jgi:PPOX class probable F420-dependent enzyme
MADEWLRDLQGCPLLELTTFRRSGQPVTTPVRFAVAGATIVVSLHSGSGKVVRARADASVRVRSYPEGSSRSGTLRFIDGEEARSAAAALRRRHRLLFLQRLLLGRHPSRHVMAAITLERPATPSPT